MASFGIGVYLLTVVWFITLMLCWISVKTGHYIGKVSVIASVVLTLILISLPKGDVTYVHGANFYDKLFIPRYLLLSFLFVSVVIGSVYGFIHVCLDPVETKKRSMAGTISRGLRSPIKNLANLRKAQQISTSLVHNETIVIKNNEEFVNKVMNSDKAVIVNFHAEWCDPCKILTPQLRTLIEPLQDLDLAIVDVEDNAELVHTFEVKAVPAVIAIRNGLVVDKFIGLVDTDMITNLIDKMSRKKKQDAK